MSGVAWLAGPIAEVAMEYLSTGSRVSISFRMNGPYAWAYSLAIILPVLPVAGILPVIGKRPLLMAGIALLALLPAAFTLYFTYYLNI